MTRGEANKLMDEELLKLIAKHKHEDEYGIPLYNVTDTGDSIDLIFHDKRVGDISIEYVPVPPYVRDEPQYSSRGEMPELWEGTL